MTFRGTRQLPHLGESERSAERVRVRRAATFGRYASQTRGSILVSAIATLALLVLAAVASAQTPEPQTTLPDIEDEVMCPVCGTTLELASESPQAIREREFIRGLIAEGRTKDEIKDALVAEFGEEVLAIPSDEGFDLVAWLVPGLAILGAAAAVLVGLRRWRDASTAAPTPQAPLGAEESERLKADLERYGP